MSSRDLDAYNDSGRFGMGGHVITTFKDMVIIRLVFMHQLVKYTFHVITNVRIAILIYAESTTGVFNEKIENTCFWKLWQVGHYLVCDEMKSTAHGGENKFCLLYHICSILF